jgi:TetR/AcrR family transcriptional repressor of nem operon
LISPRFEAEYGGNVGGRIRPTYIPCPITQEIEEMARPREFDPEKALQVAVDVFWEKGYSDASVDEVVRRSGVAKYGIYGTFGTKDELFKKVLEKYAEDRRNGIQRLLYEDNAALPELKKFFHDAVVMMTSQKNQYGCLLCNTAMDLCASKPEIQSIVLGFFAGMTRRFRRCLKRAVDKGQLDRTMDKAEIAAYMTNVFRTALMLARCGESRRAIRQHVDVALRVLR